MKYKYSDSFKHLFTGVPLNMRPHAPKIIEHVKLAILNVLSFIVLWSIILIISEMDSDETFIQKLFDFINEFYSKILLAALLGFYIGSVVISIRLLFLLKKTETGKIYTILSVIFTFLLVTNILAACMSSVAWRINDLVYE